jgi:3-hydroxyisobutyrate dehydrogenase
MIAFIWQGDQADLGSALAAKLVEGGYEVTSFATGGQKDSEAAKAALPNGIERAKSLAAAVASVEVVITLLGTSQEVEDVYLGTSGVFENARANSLFIDLSTSSPRLAKELHALAAVHDHGFVEAPFEGDTAALRTGFLRIFAAGEIDTLAQASPYLQALTPLIEEVGLPGTGTAMKLATQIALANALMGVIEAINFAMLSGVKAPKVLECLSQSVAASVVAQAFGKKIIEEDFYYGADLHQFFNELTCALDAADEMKLALPGLETAHQLYDLLVLVGGGAMGIHALTLIYYDEARCASHGLNWELAQRAMDVYERANESGYGEYDYDDDEDCDDPNCGHHHHHHHDDDDDLPSMGQFFSPN